MNKQNNKLVVLGGGHGLSSILKSLKLELNVKAIVSGADSGGSTGKLRRTFNCPAMGDIRKCLSTLSDSSIADFFETRTAKGDCIGNLIIGGLFKLYDFKEAINECHNLLDIPLTKKVIPISLDNYDIQGKYMDGSVCKNEVEFNKAETIDQTWLYPQPKANPEALKAIKEADYVILAPGSFYTSILVNLKINEITRLLKSKTIIWVANLMQEKYETKDCNLLDLYNILSMYIHIDVAIINSRIPTKNMLKVYEDYLHPLTDLKLNIPIIRKSLAISKNNTLMHNVKETSVAIKEAIKELK